MTDIRALIKCRELLYRYNCYPEKLIIMKTMTCNQLGGACDKKFRANTFEEIAEMSKAHGMEMFQLGDKLHLNAMNKMQELMKTPDAMSKWFDNKRKEFNSLHEDN